MAKKKDSKVSVASIDRVLKTVPVDAVPVSVEVGGETIEFEVKPFVDLATFYHMVHEVANSSFVVDEDTGEERYDAVYQDYMTNVAILTHVANFKPETSSDKLYRLMLCPEVMDAIIHTWDEGQSISFGDAVDRQIRYKKDELLSSERHNLQNAVAQIDKANDIFAQFVALFKDVDLTKLMDQMQKISDMDEARLGAAVVDARDKDFVERRKAALQVLR